MELQVQWWEGLLNKTTVRHLFYYLFIMYFSCKIKQSSCEYNCGKRRHRGWTRGWMLGMKSWFPFTGLFGRFHDESDVVGTFCTIKIHKAHRWFVVWTVCLFLPQGGRWAVEGGPEAGGSQWLGERRRLGSFYWSPHQHHRQLLPGERSTPN